jgi:hypothetical protein
MPAACDTALNPEIMVFFLWIAERPGVVDACGPDLCAVLVRLFGQAPADLANCGIEPDALQAMRAVFVRIVQRVPDGEAVCARLCRGSEARLQFVREALALGA